MRRRIAPVATLIAASLALGAGLVACGDDGEEQQHQAVLGPGQGGR